MKYYTFFFTLIVMSCQAQQREQEKVIIGGPFENRELCTYLMPETIASVDTSIAWENGQEQLIIQGRILKTDGVTPVPDIVLYYYHTDNNGEYSGETRHGNIRGWVKSDEQGRYAIYTAKPGKYPNRRTPMHIHPAIIEPEIGYPYYIDEWVFDNDPHLTSDVRKSMQNRGGSGVLRTRKDNGVEMANHNIILGLNVPGHPERAQEDTSGPKIGEDIQSFIPLHLWGNDKGSKACPICKYGKEQGILYFVGSRTSNRDILSWLAFFDDLCESEKGDIHVFFIAPASHFTEMEIKEMANVLRPNCVALTLGTNEDFDRNGIDHKNDNTILLYRRSNTIAKYIDIKATPENKLKIRKRLSADY
ncbi:dioxygenase family protein [Portibacter marinus]|uniref:dioxygenase family protein n=1 Tax=Portibacter marinus TaxID=2898660 RepID=UPI001F21FEED|nr:hypothetical protein [Portibacter marinus]